MILSLQNNLGPSFGGLIKNEIQKYRALAHAFSYMNLIEACGSGIPKLMEAMQEYGLRDPEFCDLEIGFRINLYRKEENELKGAEKEPKRS